MGYSRKNPNGGLRIYFFETPLEFFMFLLYPLEIPGKRKLKPCIIHKIVLDRLEIPRPKQRPLEIPNKTLNENTP